MRLEDDGAGVLPGVAQVTVREEDDLTHLFVVGLHGQAVGHADVLPVDVVDSGAVGEIVQHGAARSQVLVHLRFQRGGHVIAARPLEDLLVFAFVRLGDRAEGELFDLVGASELDHLVHGFGAVDEALEHDHGQANGEAETMQLFDERRQVDVVAFALLAHVDALVHFALPVADRDGDHVQPGVVPGLQVLVANPFGLTVGDEDAIGLQFQNWEIEGRQLLEEARDLVGEDGGLPFRGDHRRDAASVPRKLAGLSEVPPVHCRLL